MPTTAKIADFGPGDTINVHVKIKEKEKERIQPFQGTVIYCKGEKSHIRSVLVRKLSHGVAVERILRIPSPSIVKIEVKRSAKVRRANLSYLRRQASHAKMNLKYKL